MLGQNGSKIVQTGRALHVAITAAAQCLRSLAATFGQDQPYKQASSYNLLPRWHGDEASHIEDSSALICIPLAAQLRYPADSWQPDGKATSRLCEPRQRLCCLPGDSHTEADSNQYAGPYRDCMGQLGADMVV